MNLDISAETPNWQLRRYRRFILECPVLLKIQSDLSAGEVEAISKNVSIGGLLVRSPLFIPRNETVSFLMSVQAETAVRPMHFAGRGEIVRVESTADAMFLIALHCKDPVTQLEEYLPV